MIQNKPLAVMTSSGWIDRQDELLKKALQTICLNTTEKVTNKWLFLKKIFLLLNHYYMLLLVKKDYFRLNFACTKKTGFRYTES